MENKPRKLDFLVTIMFVGLIMSGLVFYGITALMNDESDFSDDYFRHNEEVSEFSLLPRFYASVYRNDEYNDMLTEFNYILFRELPDSGIIAGKNNFLFETKNNETGYNYLQDYMGEAEFTDSELSGIFEVLEERQRIYAENGVEFYLVVIPNSLTVYSENMVGYVGKISENTRLGQLSRYLSEQNCDYFLNPVESLLTAKAEGYLYNNTEDSITAFGAYRIYGSVMKFIGSELTMYGDDIINFNTHRTAGRSVAQSAGVASVVQNRTVSITDSFVQTYILNSTSAGIHRTVTKNSCLGKVDQGNTITLQFDREWNLIQLMPYFSNTYSDAVYINGLEYIRGNTEREETVTVVQFISESNLGALLDETFNETYKITEEN